MLFCGEMENLTFFEHQNNILIHSKNLILLFFNIDS